MYPLNVPEGIANSIGTDAMWVAATRNRSKEKIATVSRPWQMIVNTNLGRFTGIRNSVATRRHLRSKRVYRHDLMTRRHVAAILPSLTSHSIVSSTWLMALVLSLWL